MKLQNEIEKDLGNLLVVPKRLTSRDPFILKAKATLAKGIKNYQLHIPVKLTHVPGY